MMYKITIVILFSLFSLIIIVQNTTHIFSLNDTNSVIKNSPWISTRDNLVIRLELIPEVSVIDEVTKLVFEVRDLNGSHIDN